MRTVSKIGMAGLRLGYAAAAPELMAEFNKVRPPYNVGVVTQLVATALLGTSGTVGLVKQILELDLALLKTGRVDVGKVVGNVVEIKLLGLHPRS